MTSTDHTQSSFDPVEFKKQFPLFKHPENQSLVYLDNAATTQKPQCVIDAITDFYSRTNANANRSSHRLGRAATTIVNKARAKTASFINAEKESEIVFTSGATESINIITNGLREKISHNDEIVLSLAEHHANIVPWQELAKKTGAKLCFSQADLGDIDGLITDKTKIISVALASNTLGHIPDLSQVKKIAEDKGDILFVVDASQLVAHQGIDVQAIACDFLFFSAHKMYGPSGLGVLYGKSVALSLLSPLRFGGEMITEVQRSGSEYVNGPERFEAGTSPLAALSGMIACLDFWSAQDQALMKQYEQYLVSYLHDELDKLRQVFPDLTLLTKSKDNVGIATIVSSVYSVADISAWLDENDIAVRAGDHCAQLFWQSIKKEGALRISLAAYNSLADIDLCVKHMKECLLVLEKSGQELERDIDFKSSINELIKINHWQKRYRKIIEIGRRYKPRRDIRKKDCLVLGCEADLWLKSIKSDEGWYFWVDSDSTIVKGLAVLVVTLVNNKKAKEIKQFDFSYYFSQLGLDKHLSQSRSSGLYHLTEKIRNNVK